MHKTFLVLFLLSFQSLSAQTCDTATIAAILQLQVAQCDKSFDKQPYVIYKSTVPYNPSSESYLQLNTTYSQFLCGQYMEWSDTMFHSERGTVDKDTAVFDDYSCFIATPQFSADGTQCCVYMSTRFSEWGGSGSYFYYEKKRGKWKFLRSKVVWVS